MNKKYYFLIKSNTFFPNHFEDLKNSMFKLMDIVITFFLYMINKNK